MKRNLNQFKGELCKLSDLLLQAHHAAEILHNGLLAVDGDVNAKLILTPHKDEIYAMRESLYNQSLAAISIYRQLEAYHWGIVFNVLSVSTESTEFSTSILSGEGGEYEQVNSDPACSNGL